MSGLEPTPEAPGSVSASAAAGRRWGWLRLVGVVFGLGLFGWTVRGANLRPLVASLAALGPLAPLILCPQAAGLLLHAGAWKTVLAARGTPLPLLALTRTFMSSEAVRMTVPGGEVVGESLSAWSLVARFGVPWPRAVASVATKKAWVYATNAAWLLVALTLGRASFDRIAVSIGPLGAWLVAGAWTIACVLALVGGGMLALLGSRRVSERALAFAQRLPQRFRPAVSTALDEESGSARAHALAAALMLGQWFTEALETWLLLRLLGVGIAPSEALIVELGGTLVRGAAFFVPNGVGVQDASYVGLLTGLGVADAATVGASFVLLKRTKELVYIGLGLAAFLHARRVARTRPASG